MSNRVLQRTTDRQDHHPGRDSHGRKQEEELSVRHGLIERSDVTRQVVAEEVRQKPHAHHHADDSCRRNLGHQRESYGREVNLTDRVGERTEDQPKETDLGRIGESIRERNEGQER